MEKIREPLYKIIWSGRDVSKDVSPYLLSLRYVDNIHGKSDEIELSFEDRDDRWKKQWFPQKGDKVEVSIGIAENEERWLKCGNFQIDEIESTGPPDVLSVRGTSTYVKEEIQQKKTSAFENITLSGIAKKIAERLSLKPFIKISPDIRFKRIDQKEQTDLEFLRKLCEKYGYCVKVESEKLIVMKEEELEKQSPVMKISRETADIINFRFSNKACDVYSACEVRYWDPVTKKEIVHKVQDEKIVSGSTLKITKRCENKQQAIELARGELKKRNKWECDSEMTLVGNPLLCAGTTIQIEGFGSYDGKYIIETAEHSMSKSAGYQTSIRMRRV